MSIPYGDPEQNKKVIAELKRVLRYMERNDSTTPFVDDVATVFSHLKPVSRYACHKYCTCSRGPCIISRNTSQCVRRAALLAGYFSSHPDEPDRPFTFTSLQK